MQFCLFGNTFLTSLPVDKDSLQISPIVHTLSKAGVADSEPQKFVGNLSSAEGWGGT